MRSALRRSDDASAEPGSTADAAGARAMADGAASQIANAA
jgi:hypothetical protein